MRDFVTAVLVLVIVVPLGAALLAVLFFIGGIMFVILRLLFEVVVFMFGGY